MIRIFSMIFVAFQMQLSFRLIASCYFGARGRTRTDTEWILSPLPLPLGYTGNISISNAQRRDSNRSFIQCEESNLANDFPFVLANGCHFGQVAHQGLCAYKVETSQPRFIVLSTHAVRFQSSIFGSFGLHLVCICDCFAELIHCFGAPGRTRTDTPEGPGSKPGEYTNFSTSAYSFGAP